MQYRKTIVAGGLSFVVGALAFIVVFTWHRARLALETSIPEQQRRTRKLIHAALERDV